MSYNKGNSSKNVTGASVVDGTLENADFADNGLSGDKIDGGTISNFTSTGIDDNATSTAITIDSSENIQLSGSTTISPNTADGTDNGVITIAGGGADGHTRGSSIVVSGNESGNIGLLLLNTTNQIRNNTGGIERLRIDSTNVTVQTGNLVIGTSGKGIDFSAVSDGSRSVSSNVLDDYEEGTWTPVYTSSGLGSIVYDIQNGSYTKVGNMVYVDGILRTSSLTITTAGAETKIGGLPFTAQSASGSVSSISTSLQAGWVAPGAPSMGSVNNNTTTLTLRVGIDNGDLNYTNFFASSFGTGVNANRIYFSVAYRTS